MALLSEQIFGFAIILYGRIVEKRECVVLRTNLRHALHGSGSLRSG